MGALSLNVTKVDGSFTQWPADAKIVLMRTTGNQMPAMLGVALLGCLPGRFNLRGSPIGFVPWLFLAAALCGVTMTLRFWL